MQSQGSVEQPRPQKIGCALRNVVADDERGVDVVRSQQSLAERDTGASLAHVATQRPFEAARGARVVADFEQRSCAEPCECRRAAHIGARRAQQRRARRRHVARL